jgi:hypothetical protein
MRGEIGTEGKREGERERVRRERDVRLFPLSLLYTH